MVDGRIEVRAPMVGTVVEVLVGPGSIVIDSEALLILESMKIEVPVVAPRPGTVLEVAVAEGDTVQENDLLIVLE